MSDRRGANLQTYKRAMQWMAGDTSQAKVNICGCVGPQNGAPVCPCRMRNLQVQNGRYVEIVDHGPVPKLGEGA